MRWVRWWPAPATTARRRRSNLPGDLARRAVVETERERRDASRRPARTVDRLMRCTCRRRSPLDSQPEGPLRRGALSRARADPGTIRAAQIAAKLDGECDGDASMVPGTRTRDCNRQHGSSGNDAGVGRPSPVSRVIGPSPAVTAPSHRPPTTGHVQPRLEGTDEGAYRTLLAAATLALG